MVAIAVLSLCAAVVGLQSWPRPALTGSGWQVAEVSGPLWALLVGTTIACAGTALVVSAGAAGLRAGDPLTWAWVVLVLVAAAPLVANGLYSAAMSATEPGPLIPVFHWLFTFVPALLAGWLFSRRGRLARSAAALGTGVVTVPLLALSWSLLDSSGLSLAEVGRTLWRTAFFGVAPLALAVVLAGGGRTARSDL
ncbi:hypothetical protein [Modestobacter versicolor]|uniref:hypothetical protein n=1 Tax=Modestobacter versicolor TaxID=429133 RepID=UPI0034DE7F4D